jgi:dienelactone hydrolase
VNALTLNPLALLATLGLTTLTCGAGIRQEPIEYRQGDTVLAGVAVYDDSTDAKRPGILVVHQWKGLGDYELRRATMLAQLGYVAFCADIYGKGVRASNPEDAAKLAGKYKGDRALLRARVDAALNQMKRLSRVDSGKTAAIGYCFGGTTVLELARSGAPVLGVVSFHGGLGTATPEDARNIRSRVLALHGADDPFVPLPEVEGFMKEMRDANVDWQLTSFGGAVHSFTDAGAGSDNSKGAAYNAKADKRSWESMQSFFKELFASQP